MTTTKKAIIFDAGTLISFSMNGMLDIVEKLKEIFDGEFLITEDVRHEIIEKPIKIKRFELEALKLKHLIDKNILNFPGVFGIKDDEITQKTNEIIDMANTTFKTDKGPVKLIDRGETSCIALSDILDKKGIKNVIAVDERTTRMLIEAPLSTKKYLERRLHTKVSVEKKALDFFKKFKVIRSTELIYVAHKKNLIKMKDPQALDAMLYAVKYKGAAISKEEIEDIKKLA